MPILHASSVLIRRVLAASSWFSALAVLLGSCREPTEIRLHVRTNVPCTDKDKWKGVAVYAGAPGIDVETKAPTLTTTACDATGQVGSLVVVPSAAKDAEVGLKVVAGLAMPPEECAAHNYQGCIVARRTVRFTAHDSVDLDILLTSDCVNLSCDDKHTCLDGACTDAQTELAVIDPTEPTVRCGDNGIRCATSGSVCCLTVDREAGSSFGECKPAEQCPSTSILLNCDDSSQCAPLTDTGKTICVASSLGLSSDSPWNVPHTVSSSQCVVFQGFQLELCGERKGCANANSLCRPSQGEPNTPLPGYFWCAD
jgi:hypothetical protein